jgi:hypothetical protein
VALCGLVEPGSRESHAERPAHLAFRLWLRRRALGGSTREEDGEQADDGQGGSVRAPAPTSPATARVHGRNLLCRRLAMQPGGGESPSIVVAQAGAVVLKRRVSHREGA